MSLVKMLPEDQKEFESKYPGALQFLSDAAERFAAFQRVQQAKTVMGREIDNPACAPKWFQDKVDAELPGSVAHVKAEREAQKERVRKEAEASAKKAAAEKAARKKAADEANAKKKAK